MKIPVIVPGDSPEIGEMPRDENSIQIVEAYGETGLVYLANTGTGYTRFATDVEVLADQRRRILDTLEIGVDLFSAVVKGINAGRDRKNSLPLLNTEEYKERATDWLTDERVVAAQELVSTPTYPALLVPRLNSPIVYEEIVDAWQSAAGGSTQRRDSSIKTLRQWQVDQISGITPATEDTEELFMITTTCTNSQPYRPADRQQRDLAQLKSEHPSVDTATIFEGIIAARYAMGRIKHMSREARNPDWPLTKLISITRDIKVEPVEIHGLAWTPMAAIEDFGFTANAVISTTQPLSWHPARLVIR